MKDSICEVQSASTCASSGNMQPFFLVSSIDNVPYPLINDGFMGLAPSSGGSDLKSSLESLTAVGLAQGNHFTTTLVNGLPVLTFETYSETGQTITIDDQTQESDDFVLWGAKISGASLCGVSLNLG